METRRLLVDMDGTLTEFKAVDTLETLYEHGYFRNLKPNENVVNAIKQIVYLHPEIEVYVMSAVLTDSKYALEEKNAWLDEYLPQIDKEHRIFPPCGENKLNYVPDGVRETDHLLDDYTKNLALWEPPAKGIKLLNGINHTHETWQGNMLRFNHEPTELANRIVGIVQDKMFIQDKKPQDNVKEEILSQLNAIREDIRDMQKMWGIFNNTQEINEAKKVADTLEERYTQAMLLCGWRRVETEPDSPMTITFENRYGSEKLSFDGWEMLGQELEQGDISPVLYTDIDRFYELIYPVGRVGYYTKNLGGTGRGEDGVPVEYTDFTTALSEYDYLSVADGASIGYSINGEFVELATFNEVSLKHEINQKNWNQLPLLAQNEVAGLKNNLTYLKHSIERGNTYHAIIKGFTDIAFNSAVTEMLHSKDVWGSWLGRVANTHRPQDYIDIDITGVSKNNEVTCEVLMVHANEIVDEKTISFDVDESNFENSLRERMSAAVADFEEYFRTSVDLLGTDMEYPMELYTKNGEHTLDEHYQALEDRGYAFEADRSSYFFTQKEENKQAQQTENEESPRAPRTVKPRL